jgi:hypothetical protein
MGLNLRKILIGGIALSVLGGVFALYLRYNRTPPIVAGEVRPTPTPVAEVNNPDSKPTSGQISGVKVGPVRETEFVHRNEQFQIDRKFGFEQLLHKQGSQWEITKPYMWIYLERFVCRVTADRGVAELVEAFGRLMPNNATFVGNVVIHVLPTDPNDSWECFIHLDDVGFLAEKSMFSSTGSVRFLSRAMRLTGAGMELIYDAGRSRLDLFRVFDLDNLRIRSSEVKAMAPNKKGDSSGEDKDDSAAAAGADETASVTVKTSASTGPIAAAPDVYQCVFRMNVRLDSPDGAVVARDVLAINGIQWARPSDRETKSPTEADPNAAREGPLPAPRALNTAASSYPAMNSIPDELYDIVVTCDGGADITLVGDSPNLANASVIRTPPSAPAGPPSEEIDSSDRRQVVAQRIDFDFLTTDTTMLGPVAMKFLVASDPNGSRARLGEKPMPMTVTARSAIRYLAAAKRIILEGGSTATLERTEPNFVDEYRLAAPRLTLDLIVDSNSPDDVKVDLRRFVADGGLGTVDAAPVAVRMWRRAAGKLLGRVTLDAHDLRYDAKTAELAASGPGVIWFHNAATVQSKDDPNATYKPFYARLSNFDKLTYWTQSRRIVAEDDSQQLELRYFPQVDGQWGPQTQVVAGHVEATLRQTDQNRMELESFVASQGIEYDSEIDHLSFIGSELVYDQARSRLRITGDDLRPCYLNGALVDAVLVDLKTRNVETQIAGPSIFQVRP